MTEHNPLAKAGRTARKTGDSMTVTVDYRTFTVIRTGRPYSEDWKDALNAGKPRDDVEWMVDEAGNIRLREVKIETPFDTFMARAKRRVLSPQELRDASFHWKNIAVERGYLRHLGDHRYEVRYEPKPREPENMEEAA